MSVIIFDTETTGSENPRLIEAAWLKLSDPQTLLVEDKFCQRYNPEQKSTLGALATHHILDEELINCPSYTTFALPADAEYIIGHNIDYDWKVAGEPIVKRICTLALCREFLPGLDSYSQSAVLYHIKKSEARPLLKNAHSAMQDVENCHLILTELVAIIFKGSNFIWEDLWQYSERARIPTVVMFGKHKGAAIKDLPPDYKNWLLKQADIDPYLVKAIRGEAA